MGEYPVDGPERRDVGRYGDQHRRPVEPAALGRAVRGEADADDGAASSPATSMPNTGGEPMLLPGLLLLASAAGARRVAVVSRRR